MSNTSSSQALREFLQWEHAKQYMGTDDDMPDNFDSWVSELEDSELSAMVISVFHEGV